MDTAILVALLVNVSLLALIARRIRTMYSAARHSMRSRCVLPLSVSKLIKKGETAQITVRPQRGALRPERLFISGATAGGAADWIVNDIKVANRSQLAQSGDLPGDMFASQAVDGFVTFETAHRGTDIDLIVSYVGDNPDGCPFYGSIIGSEVSDRQASKDAAKAARARPRRPRAG